MVSQLEAGAVDMIRSSPLVDYNRLKSNPVYQAVVHPNPGDVLRDRLQHAQRRRSTTRRSVRRSTTPSTVSASSTPPRTAPPNRRHCCGCQDRPRYEASKANAYPFDLDKAQAMLQEAGVSQIEIDCLLTTSTEGNIACQMYQADLAKLGVKLNIKVLESAAWLDQVNNRKYMGGYWSPASYRSALARDDLRRNQGLGPVQQQRGLQERRLRAARHRGRHRSRPGQTEADLFAAQRPGARRVVCGHRLDDAADHDDDREGARAGADVPRILLVHRRLAGGVAAHTAASDAFRASARTSAATARRRPGRTPRPVH